MASIMGHITVESSRHIKVLADTVAEDIDFSEVNLIILPGGRHGTEKLRLCSLVSDECIEFAHADKLIAAICAAPSILSENGILDGRRATCHPDYEGRMCGAILTHENVVVDNNIITGKGLGASFEFAFKLVEILVGSDRVRQIKASIGYID